MFGGSCLPDLQFLSKVVVIRGLSLTNGNPSTGSVGDVALVINESPIAQYSKTSNIALRQLGLLSLTTVWSADCSFVDSCPFRF